MDKIAKVLGGVEIQKSKRCSEELARLAGWLGRGKGENDAESGLTLFLVWRRRSHYTNCDNAIGYGSAGKRRFVMPNRNQCCALLFTCHCVSLAIRRSR